MAVLSRKPASFSAPAPRPRARTSSALLSAETAWKAAGSVLAAGKGAGVGPFGPEAQVMAGWPEAFTPRSPTPWSVTSG